MPYNKSKKSRLLDFVMSVMLPEKSPDTLSLRPSNIIPHKSKISILISPKIRYTMHRYSYYKKEMEHIMIQVEKLSYSFPDKDLYKKVSFTLEDGQHCAFIGSNGTGKTTLIDMIMDTEKYLYDGKITKDANCRIGYVSQFAVRDKNQDISVFDYLSEVFVKNQEETAIACEEMATAEDMDAAFEKYQKLLDEFQAMDGDNYESNIYRQLKTADMHQREHVLLSQLSGGEYKLVQIMKEMLLQPNLLVMDEPDVF